MKFGNGGYILDKTKYSLYLRNKPKEDKFLGVFASVEDVRNRIERWLNINNYHVHYYRTFNTDGKIFIDFGDWHKLFYIIKED